MVEKDYVSKRDLDTILEVNKKAIEIEGEVSEQNEEIMKFLGDQKTSQHSLHEKIDILKKELNDLSKELFQIKVLWVGAVLTVIAQIIQIFLRR